MSEIQSSNYPDQPSDFKRKAIGCLGGLGILLLSIITFYFVVKVPSQNIDGIVEAVELLRYDRPNDVSEQDWDAVINLTLALHKKSEFFKMPRHDVAAFRLALEDRIKFEKVNSQTIFWIWDKYAEVGREAKRFVGVYYNELTSRLGDEPIENYLETITQ